MILKHTGLFLPLAKVVPLVLALIYRCVTVHYNRNQIPVLRPMHAVVAGWVLLPAVGEIGFIVVIE